MTTQLKIKIAIYAAIALVAVLAINYVRRFVLNVKNGVNTAQDILVDNVVDNNISTQTGIAPDRLDELRTIANLISLELETNKNMSWWEKQDNLVFFSDAQDILHDVQSSDEMQVLDNFYNNIYTDGNDLYIDLNNEFSASQVSQINYINSIAE